MLVAICGIVLIGLFIYVTCIGDVYVKTDRSKPATKMTKGEAISWRRDHSQSLTDKLNDSNRWYPKQ